MAKLSFTKLGLSKKTDVHQVAWGEQVIDVKTYLPINDKATIAANILNYTLNNGENRFPNPLQVEVGKVLDVIAFYTNITFTEKQKEDPAKLYDLIVSSGLWDVIREAITEDEWADLEYLIEASVDSYYKYHNSVFGIIESINKDYDNMNLNLDKMQEVLGNKEDIGFLREVISKLG